MCGLPVVVRKKVAITKFIEKEQIGITLNSLDEMDRDLANIDHQTYNTMVYMGERIKSKVSSGYYLSAATHKVLEKI